MGFGGRLTTRLAWQFAESSTVKSTAVRPALDPTARRPTKLLKRLAGGLGLEPRLAESESAVLPLDDPPSAGSRSLGPGRDQRGTRYHTGARLCRGPPRLKAAIGTAAAGPPDQRDGSAARSAAVSAASSAIWRRNRPANCSTTARSGAVNFAGSRAAAPAFCWTSFSMSNSILVARRSVSADLLTIGASDMLFSPS